MSVVKVNLISELDALALGPFKRLFLQRKNDNYQQATGEYATRLRQLYRSNLERRFKLSNSRKRTQKCQTDSATFRLDCNAGSQPIKRLDGITIERSSLPNADLGDRVILVRSADDDHDSADRNQPNGSSSSPSQAVVGRGIVQAITPSEIRIKLLEPLILEPEAETRSGSEPSLVKTADKEEEEEGVSRERQDTDHERETDTNARPDGTGDSEEAGGATMTTTDNNNDEQKDVGASGSQTRKSNSDNDTDSEHSSRAAQPTGSKSIIDFKIKFDTSARQAAVAPTIRGHNLVDQYSELVERVLDRLSKFKFDSAIHKNLLGFYDERSDLVHDKARVMTFSGLSVKPKSQQRLAIEQSIKRRISLIEGPAGSGKTLVAAYIAGNMSRLKRSKVLVCSPIQASVDKLAQLIDKIYGVQVVKLPGDCQIKLRRASATSNGTRGSGSRSSSGGGRDNCLGTRSGASNYIESDIQSSHCHLDKLVDDEIYLQAWNRSKDTLRNHHDSLRSHAYRMVTSCSQHRRRELEARILARADVVCCTNNQAGSYLLNGIEFSVLILDDVQVTSEIDCLVPMMTKGIKQVTLLSDTRRRVRLAQSLRKSSPPVQPNGTSSAIQRPSVNSSSSLPTDRSLDSDKLNSITAAATTTTTTTTSGRGQSSQSTLMRRKRYGKTGRGAAVSQTSHKAVDCLRSTSSSSSFTSSNEPSLVPGGLFERLLSIGLPTVDFRIQFRMHQTLSNFTNHHFYLGRLKDDSGTNEKLTMEIDNNLLVDEKRFDWLPNRKYLTAMYKVGLPSSSSASSSLANSSESATLKPMIDKLDELISKLVDSENIQESRIGVIFNIEMNNGGANWLLDVSANIKKGTIREFIGQERDFIILVALPGQAVLDSESNGSSDAHHNQLVHLSICSEIPCNFIHDDSALNCALTRARLGMFMITSITDDDADINSVTGQGEPQISPIQSPVCRGWSDVVNYYVESGLSVQ